jgi:hypothetical protein
MTLKQWADNGWLRPHQTSAKEIRDLLNIVERDLKDADGGISTDWQFGIGYNAALKLCTVLLYASGYRAERNLQHYRTLQALPLILGADKKATDDFFGLRPTHNFFSQFFACFAALREIRVFQ